MVYEAAAPPICRIKDELALHGCSGAFARDNLHFSTFESLLPGHYRNRQLAILGIDGRAPLTHDALLAFVSSASTALRELLQASPQLSATHQHASGAASARIGLVVPNGPDV